MNYERAFTPTGRIKVLAYDPRFPASKAKLIAIAHSPLDAERAERRHELFQEIKALARSYTGRKFWRLATDRLLEERDVPSYVKYRMKRAALGSRLRDVVDPRQLSLTLRP